MPTLEIDILRRATRTVEERLPAGWSTKPAKRPAADRKVDAALELQAPDGSRAVLLLMVERSVVPRDLPYILEQLSHVARQLGRPAVPVIVARYLGPSARAWLEDRDASYVDATGNVFIRVDSPALFLRDRGADRDPWRGPGRPRGTLKGPPAARVVRALVDFAPPVTVPELVRRSGASTGATYRVVEFLEQEALIERRPRGPITAVSWRRLIERWSWDYGFQRDNRVESYLDPRGLQPLLERLARATELRYVVTGSLAARQFTSYAPARLAMIYVDDVPGAAAKLDLRPVDIGANVLLAEGEYDVVFDRPVEIDGIRYAALSQTAVDLLTAPGRGPAEAEALLDWMETHERQWRR